MFTVNWSSGAITDAAMRMGVVDSDGLTRLLGIDLRRPLSLAAVAKVAKLLSVSLGDAFTLTSSATRQPAGCPTLLNLTDVAAA